VVVSVWGIVEEHLTDLYCANAVYQRLMRLGDEREAAILQSLHKVDLPKRPGMVERSAEYPRYQLVKLLAVTWTGKSSTPQVIAQVEALVVDPDGRGNATQDVSNSLAVARNKVQPRRDNLSESVGVDDFARRLEDREPTGMHWGRALFEVQEGRV
jgi:hypothetical protein